MGLDMHAARRVYVKQWDHQSPDERYTVKIACGGKPVPGVQADRISAVEEEVMEWRKANHIHAWFVENIQSGQDDCRDYHVEENDLCKLISVCLEVLGASVLVDGQILESYTYDENYKRVDRMVPGKVIKDATVAKRLLPTRSGFFFGSTAYDEDYLSEVGRTHEWAYQMLTDLMNKVPGDIIYSSSW